MLQAATCAPFVSRSCRRPLFFAAITQHMKSLELARELARAVAALSAVVAWGALLLLLAG